MIYLRDTSQNGGREPTLFNNRFDKLFIKAVHNCSAVWDVSPLVYKDTNKNKQNKTEERADKLGFVQTFLFLHRFLFLPFFSSVSLLYVSAITLKKTAMLRITVFVIWHKFDVWRKEFVNFLKFSNTSLPT